MNNISTIEHWRLHHLTFDQKEIDKIYPNEKLMPLMFTGNVVNDVKGRWVKGDHMRSSLIIKYDKETGIVHTRNSKYLLMGIEDDVLPDMGNDVLKLFY
jgi:hypothetical protein